MFRQSLFTAMFMVGAFTPPANAQDLWAPCWRGQSNATYQAWAFSSPATNPAPEISSNAFGIAQAHIQPGPFASGWFYQLQSLGTNTTGYWDLGRTGTVTLIIPNAPALPAQAWKYVSVQLTQWRDGGIYSEFVSVSLPGATYVDGRRQLIRSNSFGGGWWVEQTLWRLAPSPTLETIFLTSPMNGAILDHLVVDTYGVAPPCPTDIVLPTDAGQCGRSQVTWALPPTDGCLLTNLVCTPPSGATFPVGTNSVTCTLLDSTGWTASCVFRVVILDTETPVLSCTDVEATIPAGDCGQTIVNYSVPASDNCSLSSVVCLPPSGSQFPVGTNAVTCVATDTAGNTATCAFNVLVQEIVPALEGDVAPRPSGNGNLTVADWVLVGRLAANLEVCASPCECLKADCAPRPCGNGVISIPDWVQAGRYAAGLDAPSPACGPHPDSPLALASVAAGATPALVGAPRTLALQDFVLERGQIGSMPIVLEAAGDESALGLSLSYDPALLRFVSARVGSNAPGATLLVNSNQTAQGRLGLALMLPPGVALNKGLQTVAEVSFRAVEGPWPTASTITLADQPIPREVVGAAAQLLPASMRHAAVLLTHGTATALTGFARTPTGGLRLRLLGTPGTIGGLERSSDLIHWERIASLTNHTGVLDFTDALTTNAPQRFYRAVSP